tara:strand:- start:857 stop:1510 length:654 start_codon:yes stop_codon:yes gene_type:complete
MTNWYHDVNEKNSFILAAIKEHPFITQLMDGSLPKDIFDFYIQQDIHYLEEYKKLLALVGTKCYSTEDVQFFLDAATGIIHVENALHQTFVSDAQKPAEISPTCELYTSYLCKIANGGSVEEALAAILPCFTIYKDVGDYILAEQQNKGDNPYQDWINTYGGEAFAASVAKAIEITNTYAQNAPKSTLQRMEAAFQKASKLEWMFWDSAYQKEQWKL